MKKMSLFAILFFIPALFVQAQTTIAFNIDLQSMLADSTFIPERDVVQITGSLYPLDSRAIQLYDRSPIDSVFTAEVNFTRRLNGEVLKYRYEIVTPSGKKTENATHSVTLSGRNIELRPVGFNSFIR